MGGALDQADQVVSDRRVAVRDAKLVARLAARLRISDHIELLLSSTAAAITDCETQASLVIEV
jgi:hypothetical protein